MKSLLTNLYIENVAVIKKAEILFDPHFTVLTGETGAGKSIVIDAIYAILGRRVTRDIVRTGADKAFISATFSKISELAKEYIVSSGYEIEEDQTLIIQREIRSDGKTSCRINGRPAPISCLRKLGDYFISVHGQHENYAVFSPQLQIYAIDQIADVKENLIHYRELYDQWIQIKDELKRLSLRGEEKARKIDLLKYQIREIEEAHLSEGEMSSLIERQKVCQNREKIQQLLHESLHYLIGSERFDGALPLLDHLKTSLDDLSQYNEEMQGIYKRIENIFYELEDCSLALSSFSNSLGDQEEDLNLIEERLDLAYRLMRKYGKTIPDVIRYLEESQRELHDLELSEEKQEELQNQSVLLEKEMGSLSQILSQKRKVAIHTLIDLMQKELHFLDMPGAKFSVLQEKIDFGPFGQDKIEFLISTNPGEPLRSIEKVASGGELSRIMLALKSIISDGEQIATLIFDEVDSGVSGSAAQKIGFKLREVSQDRQVICITHLAQIAALADQHIFIKKQVEDTGAVAEIVVLDYEGRKREIARIIGGIEITDLTLNSSDEMLRLARISK